MKLTIILCTMAICAAVIGHTFSMYVIIVLVAILARVGDKAP